MSEQISTANTVSLTAIDGVVVAIIRDNGNEPTTYTIDELCFELTEIAEDPTISDEQTDTISTACRVLRQFERTYLNKD